MDVTNGYEVAFRTMEEYTDRCERMVGFGSEQAVRKVWSVCAGTVGGYWANRDFYRLRENEEELELRENEEELEIVLETYYSVFVSLGANMSIGAERIGDLVAVCRVSLYYDGRQIGVLDYRGRR